MSVMGAISGAFRAAGRSLEVAGRSIEGASAYVEKFVPSTASVSIKSKSPQLSGNFVAPTAAVLGDVTIGANSSVWYGAVIRGDVNSIRIGSTTSIGDRAMIHVDKTKPTTIGSNVLISPGAIVHGCTIEDNTHIGANAQVMDGATIQKNSIVAGGALVGPGKTVKTGQLWGGIPAVAIRDLTSEEIKKIATQTQANCDLSLLYAAETAKGWEQLDQEDYDHEQETGRNDFYYKRLSREEISHKLAEFENHQYPGRVLDSPISARPESNPF